MSGWGWGRRLVVAGVAIVTGAFARKVYNERVRRRGAALLAGEVAQRRTVLACTACGSRATVEAGESVTACPVCGHERWIAGS